MVGLVNIVVSIARAETDFAISSRLRFNAGSRYNDRTGGPSTTDELFMRLAIEKALAGIEKGQLPYGAVIEKGGRIVSCKHNTIYEDNDILAHAETNAITDACKKLRTLDLKGCTIYATCEPCPMCFGACVLANISRLVFSARLGDGIIPGFTILPIATRDLCEKGHASMEITETFLRDEGLALFEIWREKRARRRAERQAQSGMRM